MDVAALRRSTPGCGERIHLNNAGAALVSAATLRSQVEHLELESRIGGYEAAAAREAELSAVRSSAATLLGAEVGEVAVTTSDTAGWSRAAWGWALGGGLSRQRRIVVDHVVYSSHLMALVQMRDHLGAEVVVVGAGDDGSLDLAALAVELERGAAMVTVTHVPTHSGVVAPAAEVGALARAAGVPYFLDACQSVGQIPVDVRSIGCDVATVTGRKWLRGPRGTGLLFVREGLVPEMDPPGVDLSSGDWVGPLDFRLHDDARRFEEFEVPVAAQLGLGTAIDELLELGVAAVSARIHELSERLRSALGSVPGVAVHDGQGPRSGIVTFTVEGTGAPDVAGALRAAGVNVSVSPVGHARLDLPGRGLDAVVRASPHVYVTVEELDTAVEVVARLAAGST